MIATMQTQGGSITGICIGSSDAAGDSLDGVQSIDLELDHLCIQCDLHMDFWLDRAEISDPRLGAWLEEKFYWQKIPASPVSVEMVRTGDAYRLQLLPLPQRSIKAGFGLNV